MFSFLFFPGFPDDGGSADDIAVNEMDVEVEDIEGRDEEVDILNDEHRSRKMKAQDQFSTSSDRLDEDDEDELERGGEEAIGEGEGDEEFRRKMDDRADVQEKYWKSDVEVKFNLHRPISSPL